MIYQNLAFVLMILSDITYIYIVGISWVYVTKRPFYIENWFQYSSWFNLSKLITNLQTLYTYTVTLLIIRLHHFPQCSLMVVAILFASIWYLCEDQIW
jgi:hypothetical protein